MVSKNPFLSGTFGTADWTQPVGKNPFLNEVSNDSLGTTAAEFAALQSQYGWLDMSNFSAELGMVKVFTIKKIIFILFFPVNLAEIDAAKLFEGFESVGEPTIDANSVKKRLSFGES